MPRKDLQQLCDSNQSIAKQVCVGSKSKEFWKNRTLVNFPMNDWSGFRDNDPWLMINFLRTAFYILEEQNPQNPDKYRWNFKNMRDLNNYINQNGNKIDLTGAKIGQLPDRNYIDGFDSRFTIITD